MGWPSLVISNLRPLLSKQIDSPCLRIGAGINSRSSPFFEIHRASAVGVSEERRSKQVGP